MSAVISQAKQFYLKAIVSYGVFLLAVSALVALKQAELGATFLGGCLAAFLPFCLSVYWVFFRQRSNSGNAVAVFYRAELLKWILTIVLIIVMLRFIEHYLAFFAGYFIALLGNTILPFLMKRSTN